MAVDPFRFAILALAVFRLAHMIALENGPGGIFRRLRVLAGAVYTVTGFWTATSFFGTLLICPLCVSVWVALVLYFLVILAPVAWPLVLVLALSGAACLVELATEK